MRIALDAAVEITSEDKPNPTEGNLAALNTGGAFIKLSNPYAVGTVLSMHFHLSDGRPISCTGVVRSFVKGYGNAVSFLMMSTENRSFVEAETRRPMMRLA